MSEKLYYSIGEVAQMFQINESTLRFWEKEFDTLHPKRGGRAIRQYTQKDIEQVRVIHFLVKEKGLSLSAAQKKIKENRKQTDSQVELCQKLKNIRNQLQGILQELD